MEINALVIGGGAVALNAAVISFTNWLTTRTIKAIDKQSSKEKLCECRTCPVFDKCKEKR